jgi:hypothetical protein
MICLHPAKGALMTPDLRMRRPLYAALAFVLIALTSACGTHAAVNTGGAQASSPVAASPAPTGSADLTDANTALNTIDEQLNSISNELNQADTGLNNSEGDPSQ